MAKRKPRWAVICEGSLREWAAFCVRAHHAYEAIQKAEADPRLRRDRKFRVRKL